MGVENQATEIVGEEILDLSDVKNRVSEKQEQEEENNKVGTPETRKKVVTFAPEVVSGITEEDGETLEIASEVRAEVESEGFIGTTSTSTSTETNPEDRLDPKDSLEATETNPDYFPENALVQFKKLNNKKSFGQIYTGNVYGALAAPWRKDVSVDGCGFVAGTLFNMVTFPVSATAVALIKTIADFSTRKPLADLDYANLVNSIDEMNDAQLDSCVQYLMKLTPQSQSSQELIKALKVAAGTEAHNKQAEYMAELEKIVLEELEKTDLPKPTKANLVKDQRVILTKAQEAQARRNCTNAETFTKERRKAQRELLGNYLKLLHNVGKRTEHEIFKGVEMSGYRPGKK